MAESASSFDWINSPFYQLLHEVDVPGRELFIAALMKRLQITEGSKILHTGCGSGRYTQEISQTGADVTGVDFSFEAIEQAKQLENENLHFYQHDLRLPFWINYFQYACNFFMPLGYYKTLREYNNAARTIAQSLQADGLIILDCINKHYEEDRLQESIDTTINDTPLSITSTQDDEYFYRQIHVQQNGSSGQQFRETIMKLSIGDFTDMFSYQGMQIQEVYGDYNFADYNIRSSPRLIFIAKK